MNYYTTTGQSPSLPNWALWLANNIDALSWLVVALAGADLLSRWECLYQEF